jgi:putative transposase
MARPVRNSLSEQVPSHRRTFFATTKASMGRRLLQSERNANLLIDVLRTLVAERHFRIDDFVIMPDHVHLLMTLDGKMSIEKAMQLVKGRFSYRLKKEFGCP